MVGGVVGAGGAAFGDAVTAVSGGAHGLFIDLDLQGDVASAAESGSMFAAAVDAAEDVEADQVHLAFGPDPTVTLPPEGGGPFTDSATKLVVPDPTDPSALAASIEAADVRTEGSLGASGFARSSVAARDVFLGGIGASEVSSSCEATSGVATGTSTIVGLLFGDEPIDVPVNPAPNTVLTQAEVPDLGDGVTIILNEQELVTDSGGTRLVVTALHVIAVPGQQPATGQAYVGRSECGVVTAPVIQPRFTG